MPSDKAIAAVFLMFQAAQLRNPSPEVEVADAVKAWGMLLGDLTDDELCVAAYQAVRHQTRGFWPAIGAVLAHRPRREVTTWEVAWPAAREACDKLGAGVHHTPLFDDPVVEEATRHGVMAAGGFWAVNMAGPENFAARAAFRNAYNLSLKAQERRQELADAVAVLPRLFPGVDGAGLLTASEAAKPLELVDYAAKASAVRKAKQAAEDAAFAAKPPVDMQEVIRQLEVRKARKAVKTEVADD